MISRDKIFEILVTIVLRKNGFYSVLPKHRINGRSKAGHQIDSAGLYLVRIPFIYSIVLIAEAKLWDSTVGLPVVRNLHSVLSDLNQSLPGRLAVPKKWPLDLYSGDISANYLGAIFTNGNFSIPAETFAFSHGIFLVPIPIESLWIDKLMDKLITLYAERRCPRNCVDRVEGGWSVLDVLFEELYSKLGDEQREVLIEIFRNIIENCEIFEDLNSVLSSLHLAALDGLPVLLQIDMESMLALHDLALAMESRKNKRVKERRGQAFETWYETEFGLVGTMSIGEILWPRDTSEKRALDEEEWTRVYEVKISFPTIKRKGFTMLSQSLVDHLKDGEATLSIPLSRGLIAQVKIALHK